MGIKTHRYTPNKSYSEAAIKKQWHCVRLELPNNQSYLPLLAQRQKAMSFETNDFAQKALWIEDNISGQWWSVIETVITEELDSHQYRNKISTQYIDFYFSKEEEAVLFQFAWQW